MNLIKSPAFNVPPEIQSFSLVKIGLEQKPGVQVLTALIQVVSSVNAGSEQTLVVHVFVAFIKPKSSIKS